MAAAGERQNPQRRARLEGGRCSSHEFEPAQRSGDFAEGEARGRTDLAGAVLVVKGHRLEGLAELAIVAGRAEVGQQVGEVKSEPRRDIVQIAPHLRARKQVGRQFGGEQRGLEKAGLGQDSASGTEDEAVAVAQPARAVGLDDVCPRHRQFELGGETDVAMSHPAPVIVGSVRRDLVEVRREEQFRPCSLAASATCG
ncbi:MAG: hypothetical protein M5U12_30940 [Verrucomicrobia bacterium]|nr:hypothetical protein [Verrucomicrobiota bacterium]